MIKITLRLWFIVSNELELLPFTYVQVTLCFLKLF